MNTTFNYIDTYSYRIYNFPNKYYSASQVEKIVNDKNGNGVTKS